MRGAGFCLAVMATIVILSSPVYAEEPKPDAMLSLTQTSVGLFFGYTCGNGVLAYGDKTYPVEIDGFSVMSFGVAQAEATGEVFNLKKLEDFNGTYTAMSAEGTLAGGAGAATMRNQAGVSISLFTTTEGLSFKLGPEGVRLRIK